MQIWDTKVRVKHLQSEPKEVRGGQGESGRCVWSTIDGALDNSCHWPANAGWVPPLLPSLMLGTLSPSSDWCTTHAASFDMVINP